MKQKICDNDGCSVVFNLYNSLQKYCSFDCKKNNIKDKSTGIKPVSEKRSKQLEIYRTLRDSYLSDNPICEVKNCFNPTSNLHHKNGRVGVMVYNTKYFMACCSSCHPKKIHENPEWARSMGYLI